MTFGDVTIRLVSVVGGDTALLGHALRHYRALGVEEFHVYRHVTSPDDPTLAPSEAVIRAAGSSFVDVCVGAWHEDLNARLIRRAMGCHPDDWWVVADLDEFHVYDRPLAEVVAYCEAHGYDYAEGAFLDRVAADGGFPAPASGELWRQYPVAGLLTHRLLGARPTKVTLARGTVELDLGQHCTWTGRGAPADELYAQVHHFKWTASVRDRLLRRVDAYSSGEWRLLHRSIVDESRAFLDHIARNDGRIDVADPAFGFRPCGMRYADYPDWTRVVAAINAEFAAYDVLRRRRYRNPHRP